MEEAATVGWYTERNKAFVQIDKGEILAAFDTRPDTVRVEALDGFMVLTSHDGPKFAGNADYYLGD